MVDMFVYGTLMFDAVWDALIRNRYSKIDATLEGYARLCVRGEGYPGLMACDGKSVNGVLVQGMSVADVQLLDRFEGDDYRRKQVTVTCAGGRARDAQTYVFRNEKSFKLSESEWRVEDFGREGLEKFMADYRGFLDWPGA